MRPYRGHGDRDGARRWSSAIGGSPAIHGWASTIRLALLGFSESWPSALDSMLSLIAASEAAGDRIIREYPDVVKNRLAEGNAGSAGIGEPFELDFADAITGRPVLGEGSAWQGRRRGFLGELWRSPTGTSPR